MRNLLLKAWPAVLCCCCLALPGCGGGSSAALPEPAVSVSLSPIQATVKVGAQFAFSATVQGSSDTAVTWQVNGVSAGNAAFGTIDANGLYTAPPVPPTPPNVTVTVIAHADPTKSASSSVDVTIGVFVLPASVSLNVSSAQCQVTQQFAATVTGTSNSAVDWNANGIPAGDSNATFGTITNDGLYTAPDTIPNPPTFSVTAVSQEDSSQSGKAKVTISAGGLSVDRAAQNPPIRLGTSGGNAADKTGNSCCSGTLGALVMRDGTEFILSNNHVLARVDQAKAGEAIVQPGLVDSACTPGATVANFTQAVPLQNSSKTAVADAALAQVVAGQVDPSGAILQLGAVDCGMAQPAPPANTTVAPAVGMPVAKSGRTTGLTCSTISEIAVDNVKVQYPNACGSSSTFTVTFNNQVVIEDPTFGNPGDSGALLVNANTAQPTALLFGGDTSSGITVANPIQDVLAALPDPSSHDLPTIVGGSPHTVGACSGVSTSASGPASPRYGLRPAAVEIARAEAAKRNHLAALTADPAVLGVGIGAGTTPGSAAIVVFVERGKVHRSIPPTLDGVTTRVRIVGPLHAFGNRSCSSMARPERQPHSGRRTRGVRPSALSGPVPQSTGRFIVTNNPN
jgi:hypothetical protein